MLDKRDDDDVLRGAATPVDLLLDEALQEALGEEPRATELRRMKMRLQERRLRLLEDYKAASSDAERDKIRREFAKLKEQIAVLAEEAEITAFIEDAVRVGIEMRRMQN